MISVKKVKTVRLFKKSCKIKLKGAEINEYKTVRITLRGQSYFVKLHALNYWVSKGFPTDMNLNYDVSHLSFEIVRTIIASKS